MLLEASERDDCSRLGDSGAGMPATSLGICKICEMGLICRFEGGIIRDMGDPAFRSGGVGKDFGGKALGLSRTNRGDEGMSSGEKGGVCIDPSMDI